MAIAFQADPELIGLPGFSGTRILEVHQRATALAAHLKVGISHGPILAPTSGYAAGHVPSWMRCLYEPWWLPFLALRHRKGKVHRAL